MRSEKPLELSGRHCRQCVCATPTKCSGQECLSSYAFLNPLDAQIPASIRVIRVVLDNVPMHTGKKVQEWLSHHPRFVWYHPPVHCSWMNQVEQWFGILKRQRLRIADFADKAALSERIQAFIREWNERAHPFRWTSKSFDKILAKCKRSEAVPEPLPMAA